MCYLAMLVCSIFASVSLTLAYELDLDIMNMYLRNKSKVSVSKLLKSKALTRQTHTDTQTDTRTDETNVLPQTHSQVTMNEVTKGIYNCPCSRLLTGNNTSENSENILL